MYRLSERDAKQLVTDRPWIEGRVIDQYINLEWFAPFRYLRLEEAPNLKDFYLRPGGPTAVYVPGEHWINTPNLYPIFRPQEEHNL